MTNLETDTPHPWNNKIYSTKAILEIGDRNKHPKTVIFVVKWGNLNLEPNNLEICMH